MEKFINQIKELFPVILLSILSGVVSAMRETPNFKVLSARILTAIFVAIVTFFLLREAVKSDHILYGSVLISSFFSDRMIVYFEKILKKRIGDIDKDEI
jgi:uncharacterized membrane protein YfhO